MFIDLDRAAAEAEVQQQMIPWDLTLQIEGRPYKVRPLTNADLAQLARAQQMTAEKELLSFLDSVFEGEKPDLKGLMQRDPMKLGAVIAGVSLAFQEHLKKKSLMLGEAIASQVARGATPTPGTSSSASAPSAPA